MDRKVKIIIAAVAILALIGIVTGVIIVTGGKKNNDKATDANGTSATTVGIEDITISDEDVVNKDGDSISGALKLSHSVSNQWQSGSSYFKQYDFKVENVSEQTQQDWQVVLTVTDGTKISSSWNCECEIQGNKLIIKPAAYGSVIEPNGKVEGIGIILESPQEEVITGGEDISASQAETEKTTEKETQKETEAVTVKPEETIPVVSGTPLSRHGKLSVSGSGIVDEKGDSFRLCGISTHGIQWFPQYVNKDTFQYLRDDWGANMIRLAMYAREGGYVGGDKAGLTALIDKGVKAATELGMYVIIDWHVLNYNPNETKSEAISFFAEVAQKYSSYNNVIYEICNEPTGSPFVSQIKPYAMWSTPSGSMTVMPL